METYAIKLTGHEYYALVRLIGHHCSGTGFDTLYEKLHALDPNDATIAENKGPLAHRPDLCAQDIYGRRPVVRWDGGEDA